MDKFNFHGKIVIVTGGSRGIGKSIALGFGEAGAKVMVAARKVNFLEEVVREIEQVGGHASYVECNLTRDDDIYNLIEETVKQYGNIDILINNTGISPFVKKSEEVTKEMWNEVIQVNMLAPFLLCREAAKVMM